MEQRVAGYARVSSREQAQNSQALEQQIARLKEAGATEIFVDIQSGFKNRHRPELERLLQLVAERKVDKVIITRIDRLSRHGGKAFKAFNIFIESDIPLVALDQPLDLSNPAGRAVAKLVAVIGESESDFKTEAVRHGTKYRRSQLQGWHPPFGYRLNAEGRYALDREPIVCLLRTKSELSPADIGRHRIEAYLSTRSLHRAILLLNERFGMLQQSKSHTRPGIGVSTSGLKMWLRNPVLRGHIQYLKGKELHYNQHPDERLMTDAEFQTIEETMAMNSRRGGFPQRAKKLYPLSGLIYCDICGAAYYVNRGGSRPGKSKRWNYYYCPRAQTGSCSNRGYTQMEVIENALIKALIARAEDIADSVAADLSEDTTNPELKRLQSELGKVEELMESSGDRGGFLQDHANMLRSQITQIEQLPPPIDQTKRAELAEVGRDPAFWHETLTDEAKIMLYPHFVKAIWLRDRSVVRIELSV